MSCQICFFAQLVGYNGSSFNDGFFRNDNVSHDNFPYVNLKFIVVSVFAFDEFNYRYVKKDCKSFFKFFCRDESPRNKSEIVEGVP
ncbi:hypothetical protein D8Y99_00135 [Shigella sonnei]|nr:hypothetical protein [Shigella sonnei]